MRKNLLCYAVLSMTSGLYASSKLEYATQDEVKAVLKEGYNVLKVKDLSQQRREPLSKVSADIAILQNISGTVPLLGNLLQIKQQNRATLQAESVSVSSYCTHTSTEDSSCFSGFNRDKMKGAFGGTRK